MSPFTEGNKCPSLAMEMAVYQQNVVWIGVSGIKPTVFPFSMKKHAVFGAIPQLRNRKHFPCFYRVIETRVEVWENEKCCGNTIRRRVFPQLFRVLPNLHECFYNLIETRRKCFLFLLENRPRKITKNKENLIVLFFIKT